MTESKDNWILKSEADKQMNQAVADSGRCGVLLTLGVVVIGYCSEGSNFNPFIATIGIVLFLWGTTFAWSVGKALKGHPVE